MAADYDSYRVLAGRVRMHVRDWPGDNPPVVFSHGFSNNGLSALNLGKLLAYRRRVIAPDLRGRGDTDMPFGEYGIPTHVRDVTALLDRLGVDQFVAAGHSMGGAISVFLAAQMPERVTGLILFDGGAVPAPFAMQMFHAYYDNLQYHYHSINDYMDRFRQSPQYQPWTNEMDQLVRSNLMAQPDGTYVRRVARYVIDTERHPDNMLVWNQLSDLYTRITCPVLIIRAGLGIVGKDDQVLADSVISTMRAGLPTARVITIPEAGHTSLITAPSHARDAAVLDFLGLPL
ncbi:MAG: alpha/beta hydrolase [Anaerolineae bacterium]|nr:alpha/beta hydrolase [Anaerolineae bacterium]